MLCKEINTIKGFENISSGYKVYENGQIWSNLSNKFLTPTKKYVNSEYKRKWENRELLKEPYFLCRVTLKDKDNKYKKYLVHRIVAQAFIPNPNNFIEVNHIDANTANNNINNLEWISPKNNKQLIHNNNKKVWRCDKDTHKRIESFNSVREAERAGYGSNSNIVAVCNGKRQTAKGFFWEYD